MSNQRESIPTSNAARTSPPVDIETFYWKNQLRYKCPLQWESGAKCEYDTYDLDNLREHMSHRHTRNMGLKTEAPQTKSQEDVPHDFDPEFKDVKFAKD